MDKLLENIEQLQRDIHNCKVIWWKGDYDPEEVIKEIRTELYNVHERLHYFKLDCSRHYDATCKFCMYGSKLMK